MPFTFTAAHSSRITKPRARKPPSFDRKGSSLAAAARRASAQRSKPKRSSIEVINQDSGRDEADPVERLDDQGIIKTLAADLALQDVVPAMKYICSNMFDELPERSGMSSTRIAELLNVQKAMPPIVTSAHVHALVKSPTSVEKEVSKLARAGLIKRIAVPGRGRGSSSLSDGLVLVRDWVAMVDGTTDVPISVKEKYIAGLKNTSSHVGGDMRRAIDDEAITTLMRAGLVTASTSTLRSSHNVLTSCRSSVAGTLASIHSISRAASGSVDAVGGQGAVLASGGGGGGGSSGVCTSDIRLLKGCEVSASLPNTGAFLNLIDGARSHLLYLLSKSKYHEAPLYLLRERWDGNTSTKAPYGRSKDPFSIVLPAKTKKWKDFYGLKFDFVLAECLGAGQIEVFETGSVGMGVRSV